MLSFSCNLHLSYFSTAECSLSSFDLWLLQQICRHNLCKKGGHLALFTHFTGLWVHPPLHDTFFQTKSQLLHSQRSQISFTREKYCHFIWWIIKKGKIHLTYCLTENMVVDVFTKALPSLKVKHFACKLGLTIIWGGLLEWPTSMALFQLAFVLDIIWNTQ